MAAKIGINVVPTTSSRPDQVFKDNVIQGQNSTDTGFYFTGSPSEGTLTITGNSVTNCAVPVTLAKYTSFYEGNYWGVNDSDYKSTARTYYVDSDITTTGDGRCKASAYKTALEAVDAVTVAHTTIYVKKGIYDAGETLAMDVEGMRLVGASGSADMWGTSAIKASAADHVNITITANECEVIDIAFIQDNANKVIYIDGSAAVRYKTLIKGCYFGGLETMTYGVHGYGVVDAVAVENTFYRCVIGVEMNGDRCTIRDNVFMMAAAATGIVIPMTGANTPGTRIIDNIIQGANSTDTGISFSGSPDEGTLTISGNKVINCATPVTLAKYTSWYDNNYWGREDWRYHRETGRSGATARGADGNLFYCDGNAAATGDGKCWASASNVLAEAIALSQADIAANRNWARRNTIYVLADKLTESLVLWPQKTDIVGMGSDAAHTKATIIGLHVPATNTYYSTRWYNMRFEPSAAGVIMTLSATGAGTQFHECTFIGINGAHIATKAIQSTAHSYLKVDNCEFLGGFSGDVIDLAAGSALQLQITNNRIIGGANDGIVVSGTVTHYKDAVIANNFVSVEAVTISDGDDGIQVVDNRCISRAGTYGPGTHVITIGEAAGNIVVDKDGVAYNIPSTTD